MTPLRTEIEARISEIEKRLEAATAPLVCACGSSDLRLPEYDYAFPYTGEDFYYCEKCGEKVMPAKHPTPDDLRYLLSIVKAAMGLRDALEKFDAIHFTESGQSCAWGSDVAYEAIEAFEKAVRGKE